MAFAKKPPMAPAAIGDAIGLPKGKKFSVRNLARLKKGGRAARKSATKYDSMDSGDHEYR